MEEVQEKPLASLPAAFWKEGGTCAGTVTEAQQQASCNCPPLPPDSARGTATLRPSPRAHTAGRSLPSRPTARSDKSMAGLHLLGTRKSFSWNRLFVFVSSGHCPELGSGHSTGPFVPPSDPGQSSLEGSHSGQRPQQNRSPLRF